eukprot:923510-Alexandrium_andersonii.AAC.1
MAVYAAATVGFAGKAKQQLTTVCANALLGRQARKRTPEVVLECAGYGLADVECMICFERLHSTRRIIYKKPVLRH